MGAQPPTQQASSHLLQVLTRPGPCRRRWEQRVTRRRAETINQRAVCRVLADWLFHEGYEVSSDSLKDRVARALHGEVLSPETLRWFIGAFDVPKEDADVLWARMLGTSATQVRAVTGLLELPSIRASIGKATEYQTRSLHERHRLGTDGLPLDHRTSHVVEALSDGLDRYPYRFDTNAAAVEVMEGGTAGPLYRLSDELFAVDIVLARPLRAGETASLEYRTVFDYREPPTTEFRRAVLRRLESLKIRVEFHPNRLPSELYWAEWEGVDGPISRQEEVALDDQHSVHRYLTAVERAVVGFHWQW
jgi:hypothetical protein